MLQLNGTKLITVNLVLVIIAGLDNNTNMSLHRIIGLCSVLSSNKQPDCYSELSLVVANLWDTVMKIQTFCLFSVYILVFLYQGSARPDLDHRDLVGV